MIAPVFKTEDLIKAWQANNLFLDSSGVDFEQSFDGISCDSRTISFEKGLFFARRGLEVDGHDYLERLPFAKILAVVVEDVEKVPSKTPWILVRDTTRAMAIASKLFFGDPTATRFCVAITGTNGKTTSTFLIQSILNKAKGASALMGTVKTVFGKKSWPSSLTTPDFSVIQEQFAEIAQEGAKAFVFEASSHALDQKRLLGIDLDVAVFTNLTVDHQDYHKGIERYYEAKKLLFSEVLRQSDSKQRWAIVPRDGRFGSRLIDELSTLSGIEVLSWSTKDKESTDADYAQLLEVEGDSQSSRFEAIFQSETISVQIPLVGHFNVENAMGAVVLGFRLGLSGKEIQEAFDEMQPVPGRLERVGRQTFVDYAHTPDALENVLLALRPLCRGRLKLVFGCGGDRDRTKRPLMGEVAELHSDDIFLTSDNPRHEDPRQIIREVQKGFQGLKPLVIESDRKKAIHMAIMSLNKDDLLLIAGKGHETYQMIGSEKKPFDDREIARQFIEG